MVQLYYQDEYVFYNGDVDDIDISVEPVRAMISKVNVTSDFWPEEGLLIGKVLNEYPQMNVEVERAQWDKILREEDNILVSLTSIEVTLHLSTYDKSINDYASKYNFSISCGSTNEKVSKDYLYNIFVDSEDTVYAYSIEVTSSKGVSPVDLKKVWVIDIDTMK